MNPFLIAGGAGFIGSTFVSRVLASGYSAVVVDKLTYAGTLENLTDVIHSPSLKFIKGDVTNPDVIAHVFKEFRPQAVVNFAAETHVDNSIETPSGHIENNVLSALRLLEGAREYFCALTSKARSSFRFLQISTDEVYGTLADEGCAFREQDPLRPNNPYAASKASADHLVRAYGATFALPVLTTRCSNNYGPRQHIEKLIPRTIWCAINHKPMPIYGDGRQVRDWLHVADHCDAIMHVLEHGQPGGVYNIGAKNEKTNLEVVKLVCDLLDEEAPRSDGTTYRNQILHVEDRAGHDRRYAMNPSRIESELGWQANTEFAAGLKQTVRWYLEQARKTSRLADGTETKSDTYNV
jgi:dTDP-glucose 4,6-dehydratase